MTIWCALVWTTGVLFPAGAGFSLRQRVQTGSGAHLVPYGNGSRASFPGRKASEASTSSAEVKSTWSCISNPSCIFISGTWLSTGTLYLYLEQYCADSFVWYPPSYCLPLHLAPEHLSTLFQTLVMVIPY